MRENYGSSTKVESPLDDHPRIDAGTIDGAVKSAIEADDMVPIAKVQNAGDLIRLCGEFGDQKIFGIGWAADGFAFPKLLPKFASGALHDFIGGCLELDAVVIFDVQGVG